MFVYNIYQKSQASDVFFRCFKFQITKFNSSRNYYGSPYLEAEYIPEAHVEFPHFDAFCHIQQAGFMVMSIYFEEDDSFNAIIGEMNTVPVIRTAIYYIRKFSNKQEKHIGMMAKRLNLDPQDAIFDIGRPDWRTITTYKLLANFPYPDIITRECWDETEVFEHILDDPKYDLNVVCPRTGHSLLAIVAEQRKYLLPKLLARPEIDVNIKDRYPETVLMRMTPLYPFDMIDLLLERPDTDINYVDAEQNTCLSLAIEWKRLDVIEELVRRPDLVIRERDLEAAIKMGDERIVKLISDNMHSEEIEAEKNAPKSVPQPVDHVSRLCMAKL